MSAISGNPLDTLQRVLDNAPSSELKMSIASLLVGGAGSYYTNPGDLSNYAFQLLCNAGISGVVVAMKMAWENSRGARVNAR